MHLKIYFGNKPLFLCDKIEKEIEPFLHHDDAVFIDELNPHTVKSMIHEMQVEKVHAGVFLHSNLEELKTEFFKKFTVVTAAGGLVLNEKDEALLIFRRGKWDLPKGKLDAGETIEDCAVREVMEETGLEKVKIERPLLVTYHTYHEGSKFIMKDSHWYLMRAENNQNLQPQIEEDILETKWVKRNNLKTFKDNAFPSVVDVLALLE